MSHVEESYSSSRDGSFITEEPAERGGGPRPGTNQLIYLPASCLPSHLVSRVRQLGICGWGLSPL